MCTLPKSSRLLFLGAKTFVGWLLFVHDHDNHSYFGVSPGFQKYEVHYNTQSNQLEKSRVPSPKQVEWHARGPAAI